MDEDELLEDNFRDFLKNNWIPKNREEQNKFESILGLSSKTLSECVKKSGYDFERAMNFISI